MAITNIPQSFSSGRSVLRTNLTPDNLTAETIKADLADVLPKHAYNKQQIRFLQEYFRGYHPEIHKRVKSTRIDVDNKITVNYAWSISRDIVGYFLGKPIQLTHVKGKHRGQIEALTNSLSAENKSLVDYQLAMDASICGTAYRGIFAEKTPTNGTHLKLLRLDPIDTAVVYSTNPIAPPVYAFTSYETKDAKGNAVTRYTVYTDKKEFVFDDMVINGADPVAGGKLELFAQKNINYGGGLPIVEYPNNIYRMGDWETAVTIMDALDAVTSDGVNDIQQAVNAVLVVIGATMNEEIFATLSKFGFLNVSDVPQGVNPEIKFINQAMDASVGEAMRDYLEATLRVIVGVPDRKTRSGGGGDTGDAVFMRDGWQDIDLVAASKEQYFIEAERNALGVILYILDTFKEVTKLNVTDIEIHFNRNKTSNLQSKAQVFQTLSGGVPLAPADALEMSDLTNNVQDVIIRAEQYQQTLRDTAETTNEDSDEDSVVEGVDDTNA